MNKKKLKRDINSHKVTEIAEEYQSLTFTIVLVKPEHSGNIGSIARIMRNFNFENLVLFNPIEHKEKIFSYETQGFAMHGKQILMNARLIEIENQEDHFNELKRCLQEFDLVLATTAKGKRYTNIKRLAIFPEELTIPSSINPLKIAILFGRESRGLTNEEIGLADIPLRIPTGSSYPTLNLSQACGIILYEIFKKINVLSLGRGKNPILLADREDRQMLYKIIGKIIDKLKIRTHKKENVYFSFKNIIERAFISKKELSLITGVFSKVNSILEDLNLYHNKKNNH